MRTGRELHSFACMSMCMCMCMCMPMCMCMCESYLQAESSRWSRGSCRRSTKKAGRCFDSVYFRVKAPKLKAAVQSFCFFRPLCLWYVLALAFSSCHDHSAEMIVNDKFFWMPWLFARVKIFSCVSFIKCLNEYYRGIQAQAADDGSQDQISKSSLRAESKSTSRGNLLTDPFLACTRRLVLLGDQGIRVMGSDDCNIATPCGSV